MYTKFLRICDNCADFNREKKICLIRYTVMPDKTKVPMKRKATDRACEVFMLAYHHN